MRKVHAKSSRGPGLATWMIRPADGWRHKTRGLVKNRMLLLLGLISVAFAASLAINAWILLFFWPHPLLGIQSLFLVAGLAVTLTLPVLIYHHLITPCSTCATGPSAPGAATSPRASPSPAPVNSPNWPRT